VTGTVRANYFFGKPVDGGEITVKASSLDVSAFEVASVPGKTDRDGAFHFDIQAALILRWASFSQGAARVLMRPR